MAPFFILDQVSYCYPGSLTTGVCQVNLVLEPGTFLGVLGANGSGKSTLARLCCGLLKPTTGQVLVDGYSTANEEELRYIYRQVGMVFQQPDNQFVAATVEREIAFGVENRTLSSEVIRQTVGLGLSYFGLETLRNADPHSLSGGEKRLLSLADVWVLKPKLILVDEPLAMLDPGAKQRITRFWQDLRDQGQSMIWFTHGLAEVLSADLVLVMENGRAVWTGPPGELLAMPEQARAWGITLPPATEAADRLGVKEPVVTNEDELVSVLWK
ncbi:MAG TPA: ATP-binding cassette domain-containing protein [Firmicutes bacterium]|jgi:energy-coupling factor transport system ATP-binding protein|nr:ATP-binding cassette domain-containing protein [Bacillota bacterium]